MELLGNTVPRTVSTNSKVPIVSGRSKTICKSTVAQNFKYSQKWSGWMTYEYHLSKISCDQFSCSNGIPSTFPMAVAYSSLMIFNIRLTILPTASTDG